MFFVTGEKNNTFCMSDKKPAHITGTVHMLYTGAIQATNCNHEILFTVSAFVLSWLNIVVKLWLVL